MSPKPRGVAAGLSSTPSLSDCSIHSNDEVHDGFKYSTIERLDGVEVSMVSAHLMLRACLTIFKSSTFTTSRTECRSAKTRLRFSHLRENTELLARQS